MKELFLYRHAKTHPARHSFEDHARSLTHQGQAAAARLGELLNGDELRPQLILASDAQRTLQTARLAMAALGLSHQIMPLAELYQAGAEDILALLAGRPEQSIMVVGHNPSIEDLAGALTGKAFHMSPGFCLYLRWGVGSWEELFGSPPPVASKLYTVGTED